MRYLVAAALALFAVIGYVSNVDTPAPIPTCVTEDQPGTCVWEGHVRTYVDDVNVEGV